MKNPFKLSIIALTLTLSLTACDFFSSKKSTSGIDSNKNDSLHIDSAKKSGNPTDSTRINADSSTIKQH